ncbi:MAG: aldo/keto reductase [Rubrivivax sp.]|nr:aldo/keto reductase [Rubrivivax sp.]MBK7261037.1 aldo/keto reductase [Rubrivivax sp.]MBK8525973.1 aldo/keto reductase [Rubrivivax sp.]
MRNASMPDGSTLPLLGLGTWKMGESGRRRTAEVAAVRGAIDMGYRLIDSAEMYGEGGAETVVGEALAGALRDGVVRRQDLFIVSKVYPHNASRRGTLAACARSLQRLQLDHIDLYLLHWRGQHALADTVAAMHELQAQGRIVHWGVSNFDVDDLQELAALQAADRTAPGCACNQVYLSVSERGPEFDLLPWMRQRGMPLMAYCPIDQGRAAADPTLQAIAAARGATAAQVALAWVLSLPGVVAIPKAVHPQHQRDNLAAAELVLSADELQQIDARFPPPRAKSALAMR